MADESSRPKSSETGAAFPATRWSQILLLHDGARRDAALEWLCRTYWGPLYAFVRRQGRSPEDAKDSVQGFLARLLERDAFSTLAPGKGRLRGFLLRAMRNHLINEAEHARAARRGGGQVVLSIDTDAAERVCAPDLAEGIQPEVAYDRNWARMLLARAMERLKEEHRIQRKEALFERLSVCLDGAASLEYEALGTALGMKANAVAVAVHRLKRRLRELVLAEIEETVGSREEAEAEMKEVLGLLAGH